jgi:LPS export ABC transporter protein LptC
MSKLRQTPKVLIAVAAAVAIVYGCGADSGEQIAKQNTDVPDEVITDFVTEETDSGRVSWKLTAPKAYKFNARKVFLMDDPRIEFYDEFGNLQTTLTSDDGEYYSTSRDMLAYGNVVVVNISGDVLETDSLRYLNEEDLIVNNSPVKLTRGRSVTTGTGLRAGRKLKSVEILRDVRAVIIDEEGDLDG